MNRCSKKAALALGLALAFAGGPQASAAPSLSQPGGELFDHIPGAPAPTIESEEPAMPQVQARTSEADETREGAEEAARPAKGEVSERSEEAEEALETSDGAWNGAEEGQQVSKGTEETSLPGDSEATESAGTPSDSTTQKKQTLTLFEPVPGQLSGETAEPSMPSTSTSTASKPSANGTAESNGAEATSKPAQTGKDVRFTIDAIHLDADELTFSQKEQAEIDAILAEALHHEQTLAELNRTIGKVTSYCRSHGYPAAAAYLPAQESKDGTITVKVIPGRYGVVKFENHSKLKESVANRFVTGLKAGAIIRGKELESTLYSISDVSGTRAVGVLSPGEAFGTSDVTIRIEDGKQQNTILYVENYGSKNSGRYRYGLQQSFYDVNGTGAKASLGTLISNSHMHNYYANYELPIGHGGQTLGLGLSQMDYKLGGPFRTWGANGKAQTVSLFGQMPFYHTHDGQLKLTYGYDYRKLKDDLDVLGGAGDSEKHSHSIHVGVAGSHIGGGTSVDYDATLTEGKLGMDSDYARMIDEGSKNNRALHSSGNYTKLTANSTLVQSLGHRTDVMVKASAQVASKNLDGSEQMYLGGANAVRAYPQGEGAGDDGYLGTVEFRYYTPLRGLIFSTYFDAGHVKTQHSGGVGQTLKGWGVGLSYTKPGDWFARLDYARRIGDDGGDNAKDKGRTWFILGKIW